MTCKLIILSVECLYITYIIISWSFQREFWLTCFSVYMAKTLLLIVKCLHILILYPVLNQSSYLIAKSLMLPMLGRQALFVFGVSSCHSVVAPILIWWLYKDNQIIHLTFDTSDLSSKFRLQILVKWFILNTLYRTCVFFLFILLKRIWSITKSFFMLFLEGFLRLSMFTYYITPNKLYGKLSSITTAFSPALLIT